MWTYTNKELNNVYLMSDHIWDHMEHISINVVNKKVQLHFRRLGL